MAQTCDQISKSDSDIVSLTWSLWHLVSDIESLTLCLWHLVSDIESLTLTDSGQTNSSFLTYARCLRITLEISWDWHWTRCLMTEMSVQCKHSSHSYNGVSPDGLPPHPKKAPPSPARQRKPTTRPAAKLTAASSPSPHITSAPSLAHVLVVPTTPIKECNSDIRFGSTIPAISCSTSVRPRGDSVARGSSTTCRGSRQSAVCSTIWSLIVSAAAGDAEPPMFDPFLINSSGGDL